MTGDDLKLPVLRTEAGIVKTLDQWREFARRDDCLNRMVPSDLRLILSNLDQPATVAATARANVAATIRLARAQAPHATLQSIANETSFIDLAALRRLLDDIEALIPEGGDA